MRLYIWIKKRWPLLLILVLLLYLIIGATAPFYHYPPVSGQTKEAVSQTQFSQGMEGSDRAMLLETNESAWEERMRLLNLAENRIILSTFDFRDGESPRDILSVMLHKADQGVKVQILVDGFSGLVRMEGRSLFYALSSHPNVEIKLYNPINLLLPWKTQGRMHDKYIIADDYAYILGGRNTFDYFIGSYPAASRSYDREVLIYNTAYKTARAGESSLNQVEDYFNHVWDLDVCRLFHDDAALADKKKVQKERELLRKRYEALAEQHPELFYPEEGADSYYEAATVPAGKITLVSNPTDIYAKEPVVFYTLTELMKKAQETVNIHSPYAVFNDYMYETMAQVTEKVPVSMMVNSVENGDNFFASSDYPMHRREILQTGVQLLEYDGGTSYHGKSLVIDHKLCAVGSYNFDLRSTYLDTELMLVIESPKLSRQLEAYMMQFEKDCRQVLPDGSFYFPEHIKAAPVPLWKRAAWKVTGFFMQPFRFLL